MTSEYQSIFNQIEQLSENSARFRKVALHIHSPQSHDFGRGECDKKLNDKEQYLRENGEREYLKHFIGKFDIVAITDHMRIGFACRLASLARPNADICVLPGIELNLRLAPPLHEMRLHVLAIFPDSKSEAEIERIFPASIPPDTRRTGEEEIVLGEGSNFRSLSEFVDKIRDHNGLCIAAHVENGQGIRCLFRQTGKETLELFNPDGRLSPDQQRDLSIKFRDFFMAAHFHGLEVSKCEDRKHYSWEIGEEGRTYHVPVFLTFDAHNIETVADCQRLTYIKTTDLSWNGLAEAIKFPQTRIRFSDDRVPPPHILGIEIVSPIPNKGFFSELKIGFTENLNCIIGPRGSGKSTIVDAFRYIFGYNRTLKELDNEDLVNAIKNRQRVNLAESRIRIFYRLSEGVVQVLEATYDPKSDYATKVFDMDGNVVPVPDIDKTNKYPLRLFGWSEIENLGRDPQRQLDLLDKLIEGLSDLQEKKKLLKSELEQNRGEIAKIISQLKQIIGRNDGEIRRYQEYKSEFEKLNTEEVQQLFEDLDQKREHTTFLSKLKKIVLAVKEDIQKISLDEIEELEQDAQGSDNLREWWNDTKVILPFAAAISTTTEGRSVMSTALETLEEQIGQLLSRTEAKIAEIEQQIRSKVAADPSKQILADLRNQAKERLDAVRGIKDEYEECYESLDKALATRGKILINLLKNHQDISKLRVNKKQDIEKSLNEFQTPEMRISLQFNKDGNRADFAQFLNDCTALHDAHIQYRAKKWPQLIAEMTSPIRLSQLVMRKRQSGLITSKQIDGKKFEIDEDNSIKILSAFYPFAKDELAEITVVDYAKLDVLMKLQEIDWDDSERILRNDQPIDISSPGQRSSAMLPLIALSESVPLLIDQPEDNLDNRLVGRVLVDILAKLKERRQIIVATHNPNIVVLGDAEQVIVLDAVNDRQGKVDHQASIDEPKIVQHVIELMEGGKDAFVTRNTRYQRQW